ncbi:hypothetical protein E3G71_001078 [Mycobacteroides abscessus]|uniref:hypothetical protein n=1 Tax=Mycobacteroides abscessus TaxID=36809 RepID=UPI00187836AA|nr:hypothetical protein [Mycobacteroides abscessus]MBE5488577.1 hypothetical protein [Mycobacteroides abscessus]MBE5518173.1 hypothetical protein [Mycobacteroides abscessus]MBN7311001.1 hypothetical protein [Mycobacteroides abscessus subsp. abscessus]
MSTDYRDLITNLTTSIHDDVTTARARLHEAIELLEQGLDSGVDAEKYTDAIDGLRVTEQRLTELVRE